ncbi:cilia and flagella-associated protein 47-like isoform X2 [Hydractinia symbiolongicarpus]|uniref:cilia and flagella-associated protein 47-like isoform X2 n=1 Tax=Hydractinia symbiolongicarpus TaxID=13093 RepID=UPI00254DE445|nr:cilia and flagella-associated protein 47-like isoform X2 [Hydractinia symbiolongicarpus]
MISQSPIGVKITPPIVEFIDAESGIVHQMKIDVQNLSKTSKHIRFLAPATNKFRLQCKEVEKTIAPGLDVSALVEYYNNKDEDCQDCIVFMIDDKFVEVPLFSYAPKSTLIISGSVDFGTTVADGQLFTKEISILNHGLKCGDYKIFLKKEFPFHILPLEGTIHPGYSQPIRFEFISKNIGNIEEHVRVELSGQSEEFITVKANVVPRALVLLSQDKQKHIDCIKFGSAYYGTDVVHKYWLYNASPEETKFIAVLDDEGKGQEVGIDVTKSVIDVCTQREKSLVGAEIASLISVTPSQGTLMPYEKKILYFKFSPRFVKDAKGWKHEGKRPPRQDYAVFLKFQIVANVGNESERDIKVELALTGTALPIFLSILPSSIINYNCCKVGEREESVLKLRNDSPDLPICYAVKRIAHFHAYPACGYVNTSEVTELNVVFQPNQVGNFKRYLTLDVIGQSCDISTTGQPLYKKVVIDTHQIQITGSSHPTLGKKHGKSHSATRTQSVDNDSNYYLSKGNTSVQVYTSKETSVFDKTSLSIKDCQISPDKIPIKIAHPDDRATSIRPSDRNQIFMTKFTKKNRYTYVDPDYSFTDEQKDEVDAHKNKYTTFLRKEKLNRMLRKDAIEFQKMNNKVDLGIKPAQGLKPTKITIGHIKSAEKRKEELSRQPKAPQLLSSKIIAGHRKTVFNKEIEEGLKAIPSTSAEKEDCKSILTPQELFGIFFEPHELDFGDVCELSECMKELRIANNISKAIHVDVEINCRELRQTSPLSQVIPSGSVAKLQVIFESSKLGKFERSINYTINGYYKSHLIIHANVVTVNLELSNNQLLLTPLHAMPAESGFRKCVTLKNSQNMDAEFTWSPVIGKDGTSFTIRPAKGVVQAFSVLECEVTFYPSYSACCTGEFIARVEGGNELNLSCTAEIGITSCSFVERRLMLGTIPLNIMTVRSAYLKNTSNNHAYFKVVDTMPIQGMFVSPKEGVVPVGGTTELTVCYKPTLVQKFDTEIQVDIQRWKTVTLRICGLVEPPTVDVDMDHFDFGGIFGSATASIPFKITNLGKSKVQVVFDFSHYRDFKVIFPKRESEANDDRDYCFHVTATGQEVVEAVLQFTPTEVASYDFILPVSVNHIVAPSPPPSPYPASIAATRSGKILSASTRNNDSLYAFEFPTPCRRVRATGLRSPLQLSRKSIEFNLPSGYYDLNITDSSGRVQSITLANNSRDKLSWSLDIDSCKQLFQNGVFTCLFKHGAMTKNDFESNYTTVELESGETYELKVAFNPLEPGVFKVTVPLILNNNKAQPYSYIDIIGELQSTQVHFEPAVVIFNTVPLQTEVKSVVRIIGKGFKKDTKVFASVPSANLEDGDCVDVFTLDFLDSDIMQHCAINMGIRESCTLTCQLTFKSAKPVSFSGSIVFTIGEQSCILPATATADNCLLTTYDFLTNAQNDFHIICERVKEKKDNNSNSPAEIEFVPCVSPIRAPTGVSMVTSGTSFSLNTSSYEDTTISSSSSPTTITTPPIASADALIPYQYEAENLPDSSSGDGKHMLEIMRTVQRWYSSQCWSSGLCILNLPYSLRKCYSGDINKNSKTRTGPSNREEKKESRTIIDIVVHLCGKAVPGIPLNMTLPSERGKRVQMILWLYSSLLTFLRCQGAMVASIKPEYLLDAEDYNYYQRTKDSEEKHKFNDSEVKFEMLSRKAWTDLLLQIIKVLVLARVTPSSFKKMVLPSGYPSLPVFNPDPLCSNVYSVNERIVLAWLNHHYEQQRVRCWRRTFNVHEPASRWIVNFDNDFVDGLVLASLLSAYCPYLVKSHLHSLYTHPHSAEQCLHNALKVVEAFRFIGLDYDVLVKLQNPSTKPIVYQAVIAGENAELFKLPAGSQIQVPSKGSVELPVEYRSRFLHPCTGTLVLVGKRVGSAVGSTLVFTLKCSVDKIMPKDTVKCVSPCYELKKIYLNVTTPFTRGGNFTVALVETSPEHSLMRLTSRKNKPQINIPSKTDHGRGKRNTSPKKVPNMNMLKDFTTNKQPLLSAFWTPASEVHLDVGATKDVEVQFLPFDVGMRHCSVLFLNKDIGEFLYSIEAESSLPLPSEIPFKRSDGGRRVTSAMAVQHSQGLLREDNTIVYLHCEADTECVEELQLPAVNAAKERALRIATHQRMCEKELKRRELTGITSSETILSAVSSLQINEEVEYTHPADVLGIAGSLQNFTVDVTSPFFKIPPTVCVPLSSADKSEKETVKIPLTVEPCKPGQYPCKVILKSLNDIRVYHIECTVNYAGTCIELEFSSPTHQKVLQNVPIINHSDIDWNFQAEITGNGFFGPTSFTASAGATSNYPLIFRPVFEGIVEGQIILRNRSNGAESVFILKGLGTKPLALDTIEVDCIVNEATMKVVEIKNGLNHKMVFQTFSDLDMLTGPAFITVLPNQTIHVPITVLTKKRGIMEGMVMFVYDAEFVEQMGLGRTIDEDSDDDADDDLSSNQLPSNTLISTESSRFAELSESDHFKKPYRVWYSFLINSMPSSPEKRIEVKAPVRSTTTVELLLKNPLEVDLLLDVTIDGAEIYGEACVTISPLSSMLYQLEFAPTVVGHTKASVIFHGPSLVEFWYELQLVAEQSLPQTLPTMQCSLGKSCSQLLSLHNPTVEPVIYSVACSNTNNFSLENVSDQVSVPPISELEVQVTFTPSHVGSGNHQAELIFDNIQTGMQKFILSGIGELPGVNTDHVIHAVLGENKTTIVNFHNPFEHDIVVDVQLQELPLCSLSSKIENEAGVYTLLLKVSNNLILPPRQVLDIPISYSPNTMQKCDAVCTVTARQFYLEEAGRAPIAETGDVQWKYDIQGIPLSVPVKISHAPVFECRARERLEEKLEISFAGLDLNVSKTTNAALMKSLKPMRLLGQSIGPQSSDLDEDYTNISEVFKCELQYDDKESESDISRSVALQLRRKRRHQLTGVVTLVFEVILSPSRTFNHLVHLCITSSKGGVWKYPLRFLSTEPTPDDVIVVESAGLNKDSNVAFRLWSQTSDKCQFEAFFASGSDNVFTVSPSSGVLLPVGSDGTLLTVSYRPSFYGRTHQAKLLIQSRDTRWIYDVRGVTPTYQPPRVNAATGSYVNGRLLQPQKKNFVRQNLRLVHTAVSSPLKGEPLVQKFLSKTQ